MTNNTIATITMGNHYDSRIGGRNYAMWTDGDDYEIRMKDGRVFGFQTRFNNSKYVNRITTPVQFKGATREVTFEKLNKWVKICLFKELFPNGTEDERNLFILGEVEGAKKNRINAWADAHMVHSREVTLRLREVLGDFDRVRFVTSYTRQPGTGYRNKVFVIDEKWQVTVSTNNYSSGGFYSSYRVDDYTKICAQQKYFGRRVARLAKKAGVPWNIGIFVGHIEDDDEAISILRHVKNARGTASEDLQYELSCGIGRRTDAIAEILGETWAKKLDCSGQKQTRTLANYLLGE